MGNARTGNKSVLPEIRPMDDHQAGKSGRASEALRAVVSKQADSPLRNKPGSEKQGGRNDGNANMTCMSCDKFECTEVGPCVRWAYAPGTDEIESKENAMSPAPKATAWTDGLERC